MSHMIGRLGVGSLVFLRTTIFISPEIQRKVYRIVTMTNVSFGPANSGNQVAINYGTINLPHGMLHEATTKLWPK